MFTNGYKKTVPDDHEEITSDVSSKDEKLPGTGEEPPFVALAGLGLSGVLLIVFLIVRKKRSRSI